MKKNSSETRFDGLEWYVLNTIATVGASVKIEFDSEISARLAFKKLKGLMSKVKFKKPNE